jgi:hypothetical protein
VRRYPCTAHVNLPRLACGRDALGPRVGRLATDPHRGVPADNDEATPVTHPECLPATLDAMEIDRELFWVVAASTDRGMGLLWQSSSRLRAQVIGRASNPLFGGAFCLLAEDASRS